MKTRPMPHHILIGLTVMTIAGCFPYNPYGYNQSYGPYSLPPGNIVPRAGAGQGAYLSPNDFSSGTPAYTPTQTLHWHQSQQTHSAGRNDVRRGGGSQDVFEEPLSGKIVPNPRVLDEPLKTNSNVIDSPLSLNDSFFDPKVVAASSVNTSDSSSDENGQFTSPKSFEPAALVSQLAEKISNTSLNEPNPYAYDKNYTWLRGVVEYDKQDNLWHLLYDITPDATDQFGGEVTLIDDSRLNVLRNGEIILIDGHVDDTMRDQLGKPGYRIERFSRLVPKDQSTN